MKMKRGFAVSLGLLLSALLVLTTLQGTARAEAPGGAAGKELPHVITDISFWDVDNGRELPMTDGKYQMTQSASSNNYRLETKFDLSAYDGNLENGDYFNLTVPEPLTVPNGMMDLLDEETGIAIGKAVVTSNGTDQGGTVRVTLQNLDQYLARKHASAVQGLKGTFFVGFHITNTVSSRTITFRSSETHDVISHEIAVKPWEQTDYTDKISKTNFGKYGGVLTRSPYISARLGRSGEWVHIWTIRVNVRQAAFSTFTVRDQVSEAYAPMQFIPETMQVWYGYYDSSYSFHSSGTLTEETDYTVTYNTAYNALELHIPNASGKTVNGRPASYQIRYSTTSPADGSKVGNGVEVSGDDTPLTIDTESSITHITYVRDTRITEGGSITVDPGYRIVLYKVDEKTGQRLSGAVFRITTPSGEEITLPATDSEGRTYSRTFTSAEASGGTFRVMEVTAPKGYRLLTEPIDITVGSEGTIRTITNEKEETPADPPRPTPDPPAPDPSPDPGRTDPPQGPKSRDPVPETPGKDSGNKTVKTEGTKTKSDQKTKNLPKGRSPRTRDHSGLLLGAGILALAVAGILILLKILKE